MSTILNAEQVATKRRNGASAAPPEGELSQILISKKSSVFTHMWPDQKILYQTIGQGDDTILLNPDPVLEAEGQEMGLGIYDDILDGDPHLDGQFETRVQAAIGLSWEIEPADDSAEAKADAALVEELFWAIPNFEDARRRALHGKLLKGYSVTELVWGGVNGWTGVVKLKDHDQRNWLFDVAWRPRYVVDFNQLEKAVLVDARKVVVMRHKAAAWNPYGRGIGRLVYYLAMYKRHVTQFWAVYCEKYGTPTVDATYQKQAERNADAILEMAETAFERDAVAHDEFVSLKPLGGGGTGDPAAYERFLDKADEAESKAVCGQVLSADARPTGLGSGQQGAQSGVRQDYLEYDAFCLQDWQDEIGRMFVEANRGPRRANGYPRTVVHAEPPDDTGAIADTIGKAVDFGLDVPEDWTYETLGIPKPKAGEAVLKRQNPLIGAFGAPGDNLPPNAGTDPAAAGPGAAGPAPAAGAYAG